MRSIRLNHICSFNAQPETPDFVAVGPEPAGAFGWALNPDYSYGSYDRLSSLSVKKTGWKACRTTRTLTDFSPNPTIITVLQGVRNRPVGTVGFVPIALIGKGFLLVAEVIFRQHLSVPNDRCDDDTID
jgi:hypothetical protein